MGASPREPFTFSHRLRVRWAEVDPQGIVFNANYFTYFDVAVTEYWRATGVRYPEDFTRTGTDSFAVSASAEFRAPARFDDEIDVSCRTSRVGRTSLTLALEIHRGDELLTRGQLVYVNADVALRRPVPWDPRLVAALEAFERHAPERGAARRGEPTVDA
ncbi:MAG: acyl-CoA thioesterase [Deltaproteobacteria bacterium]|nr:acyl-CoA thioesterase [Deltaproteobacteria bacterium]